MHSHQEVGIACTYDRDRSIKKWLDHREIPWIETPYGSVRRGLKRREDWNAHWNHIMFKEPLAQADWSTGQAWTLSLQWMKWAESREVPPPEREEGIAQTGGPSWGQRYLRTFLEDGRGRGYMAHISKPEGAKTHCSRLSTYLAWGNLSLKQVVRALAEA